MLSWRKNAKPRCCGNWDPATDWEFEPKEPTIVRFLLRSSESRIMTQMEGIQSNGLSPLWQGKTLLSKCLWGPGKGPYWQEICWWHRGQPGLPSPWTQCPHYPLASSPPVSPGASLGRPGTRTWRGRQIREDYTLLQPQIQPDIIPPYPGLHPSWPSLAPVVWAPFLWQLSRSNLWGHSASSYPVSLPGHADSWRGELYLMW